MSVDLIASVLSLDRRDITALKLVDPYSLHRIVYSLYEDVRGAGAKSAGHSAGILYCVESLDDFQGRRILMLANRKPADCVDGRFGKVQSRPVPPSFLEHGEYNFKILINPTRREGVSGKIMPIKGRSAIAAWFAGRAETNWGFRVDGKHLRIDDVSVQCFPDKNLRPVTIAQAEVRGLLSVIDQAKFKISFSQGLGRAKAFGCGLLQIDPRMDRLFA